MYSARLNLATLEACLSCMSHIFPICTLPYIKIKHVDLCPLEYGTLDNLLMHYIPDNNRFLERLVGKVEVKK